MKLTEQQLRFFDTFGFLSFPGLLAKKRDSIIDAFEQVWAERGGGHHGKPHDYKRRSEIVPFMDQSEYLCTLLDDSRIEGIASSILGDDFNYTASDGNFYVGDTQWHSDGYRKRKYPSLKMALYLDPLTRDTGCLRVIPGSHRVGDKFADAVEEQVRQGEEMLGIHGRDVPALALENEPGDLVLFNHSTKHGSFGGSGRRRMFTINLQKRYRKEDLPALRKDVNQMAGYWADRAYGEAMIRTAGPARMRHLEQRLTIDGDLAELARKARQEMGEPSRL